MGGRVGEEEEDGVCWSGECPFLFVLRPKVERKEEEGGGGNDDDEEWSAGRAPPCHRRTKENKRAQACGCRSWLCVCACVWVWVVVVVVRNAGGECGVRKGRGGRRWVLHLLSGQQRNHHHHANPLALATPGTITHTRKGPVLGEVGVVDVHRR